MKVRNVQRQIYKSRDKRFTSWRYIVVLMSLVFMILSALPNFYQPQENLVVSSENFDMAFVETKKIHQLLTSRGFMIDTIDSVERTSRIELVKKQQLAQAKELLSQTLGDDYLVERKTISSIPMWLENIGGEPIKLGLDLSGGVLFVLDVDGDKAFEEKVLHVLQSIKLILRKNDIRNVQVLTNGKAQVVVKSIQATNLRKVIVEIQKRFKALSFEQRNSEEVVFEYSNIERSKFHQEIMLQALSTLRGRIEKLGITEAVTHRQGSSRIRIELPGVKDPTEARRVIGATASLDFYQTQSHGGKVFKSKSGEKISVNPMVVFSGKHIENAQLGHDEMGMPLVNLDLDNIGGDKMLKFSNKNIGKPMITVFSEYQLDDSGKSVKSSRVISVATIQSQLGSRFSITNLSRSEAKDLAILLRAGSLEAPITVVKEQTINATLGESNIENGLAALMLGVAFTFAFMALWYKRLGLIANAALLLNLVCLLGLMSLLPGAILTLPGIAGLVLTVGMAVDTNVLIFERIKEEENKGRSSTLAIEYGYKNAFSTIFDANITTLITALILFSIGYGPVKGFAITLGLGILTSMFTGVFISRILTELFYVRSSRRISNQSKKLGEA